MNNSANLHRQLPAIDSLLQAMPDALQRWGHEQLANALRDTLDELRTAISAGNTPALDSNSIGARAIAQLEARETPSLIPVMNLTGTVLHTNLGRASLPPSALEAVVRVSLQASNLEFDLEQGERGDRESHVESLICELTGAEAATVVNNNAAAVLLVLNTLAMNREVPVSRGELVEIGGSFRIPEVMQRSNCTLVEVGATNRTHLKDYRNAIGEHTALLMKVHTSNYEVQGFTQSVPEEELAALAHEHKLPMVIDMGSGSLVDFAALGLPDEPTARQAIENGADVITFSGDKLLGGPQAGLIAGSAELIARIRSNPLKRALRLDKMTLAALEAVLKLYRNPDTLLKELPTLRQLTRPAQDIRKQALALREPLANALGDSYEVAVEDCHSQIGSGALPIETLPSCALAIRAGNGQDEPVRLLAIQLRKLPIPIIGRIKSSTLWLDLRCLEQDDAFLQQLDQLAP